MVRDIPLLLLLLEMIIHPLFLTGSCKIHTRAIRIGVDTVVRPRVLHVKRKRGGVDNGPEVKSSAKKKKGISLQKRKMILVHD